jgi:hypothetical protein
VTTQLELERAYEPAEDTVDRVARAISILLEDEPGKGEAE